MDQVRITTPGLPLRPELFEDNSPLETTIKKFGRYQITRNTEGKDSWTTLKFGPEQGAYMSARLIDGAWICKRITIFLPRWLNGHNGVTITSHELMLAALQRYYQVASLFPQDGYEHHVLPGIGQNNPSEWDSIEFPYHVMDETKKLLLAFESASHPRIRKPPLIRRGETVHLKGEQLEIKVYNKAQQMRVANRGALAARDRNIVRIEVKWSGTMLRDYLSKALSRLSLNVVGQARASHNEQLTCGFSYETLFIAFRLAMLEIAGVFVSVPNSKPKSLPSFMAAIAQSGMPLAQVESIYLALRLHQSKTQVANIKLARQLVANTRRMELIDYLPEYPSNSVVLEQPQIHVPDLEREVENLEFYSGPISEGIRSAYHDANCSSPGHWIPYFHGMVG